jgi:hypothetical protein
MHSATASLSFLLALACATAACQPDDRCGADLYFDGHNCRPCPKDATLKHDTCVCNDDERYEYVEHKCQLREGATPPEPEDAGMLAAGSCQSYCDFAQECIGDNPLAMAALSSVVSGLHASDPAACRSACEAQTMSDEGADVLACFEAGRAEAACADDMTQAGLMRAITLMGECCGHKTQPLCKSICAALTSSSLIAGMIDFCD